MTRVNILLLVALIATGAALVRVSYETRRLYAALDKAQAEIDANPRARSAILRVAERSAEA